MSWADTHSNIEKRFKKFWRLTPIVYGNLSKPSDIGDDPWVRLSIKLGEEQRVTLGTTFYRTPGVIIVQIFTPSNKGLVVANELAGKVGDIWRGQQFSGISCSTPSVNDIGVRSGLQQTNVTCPFYVDENKPTKTDIQLTA